MMLGLVLMVIVALGLILDGIPTVHILTALIVPVFQAAGVDLIHFGSLFALADVIGRITPPVGPSLMVAAVVGKSKTAVVATTMLSGGEWSSPKVGRG